MKRIVALIMIIALGYFLFSALYNENQMIVSDNKVNLSEKYLSKTVTETLDLEAVFGTSKDLENGSANIVTAIVVDYRSFDTLGEVTVLFLTSIGVGLLLTGFTKKYQFKMHNNKILVTGAQLVVGLILIIGVYMFTHGHLSPGGGFPGGSMIGAAILLLYLSNDNFRIKVASFKLTESLAGIGYIALGVAGLFVVSYFLENLLPTGRLGDLISGGMIPIVYVLIGLKVGSEVSGIIHNFLSEEVQS